MEKNDNLSLDYEIIWQETAEKLTKYFSSKGFTYADIIAVLPKVIELFENLLYKEKDNEKI